jgi:cytochrome P450
MAQLKPFPEQDAALPVEFGSLLQFSDNPIDCMKRLQTRFGDLAVLQEGEQKLTFVFSPELNRQVLSNGELFQSQFFAVRGNRKSSQRRVTSGLLSQNGEEHRNSRRALKDVFALKALPAYHDIICNLSEQLVVSWKNRDEIDLNAEMVQFMLRMTSALLFGVDDAEFAEQLGQRIDTWTQHNHQVGMGAMVSDPRFAGAYQNLLLEAEQLEKSIRELFARHRRRSNDGRNILSLLLNTSGKQSPLSDDALIGHATLLFAAAHLTTAHTFSWTVFLLAQHPQVMRALKQELEHNVAGLRPEFAETDRLPLLDAVIRESMRILPASAYSQRITSDFTTLENVRLPPGSPVIFSQFITHHRNDLYRDADQFQPERWSQISPSPYTYLPFGAGPRMCIGAPLAMSEIRTALIIMLKHFSFGVQPGTMINGDVISTMLGPASPIRTRLLPAEEIADTVPVSGNIHSLVKLPSEANSSGSVSGRAAA